MLWVKNNFLNFLLVFVIADDYHYSRSRHVAVGIFLE